MRRDIKKRIFVFCLLLSVFLLAAVSFADGSRCRCDRLLNEDGRCTKCGEDPSLCSCSCWCGRSSRVIETGAGSILICEKCGSSCALCSCSDKQTAQRLEALSLEGKTVMNGLPLSGLVPQIVCGVTVLCAFALVLWIFSSQKKNSTIEREKIEKRQRRSHATIMNKIETQAKTAEAPKKKSDIAAAAEKNIKWPLSDIGMGIAAYELTNAVEFHRSDDSTVADLTLFSLGSYLDPEGTLDAAFKGAYGKTVEKLSAVYMAARSSDGSRIRAARPFFDEDFFEKNETAISGILSDTGVDKSSVHQLLKLPFTMEVKVGSSEPQVQRFAKEKCELYTAESSSGSYLKQSRFPQITESGRNSV